MLPIKYYISEKYHQLERKSIFNRMPQYVGIDIMLEELGSYVVSERDHKANLLIRNPNGIELISNICRHRQALLFQDNGQTDKIICPFHRWQYDLTGKLINAPLFKGPPCDGLENRTLFSWKHFLFKHQLPNIILQDNSLLHAIQLNDYQFSNTKALKANYNWKIFVDNYLDDYHMTSMHPGLRHLVNLDDLNWEFYEGMSVQKIALKNHISSSKSDNFNAWAQLIHRIKEERPNIQLYDIGC